MADSRSVLSTYRGLSASTSTSRQVLSTMQRVRFALMTSAVLLAACADAPTEPSAAVLGTPSFSRGGYSSVSCAASGAAIVGDQASLRAALAAAQPGSVVAVTGTIPVTGAASLDVPEGVTLTCAEPGAGLVRGDNAHFALVSVTAPNVTISGLALDGSKTGWPVYVVNGIDRVDVAGVRVEGNAIKCGWSGCVFIVGAANTVVSGNEAEATRPGASGIHLQGGAHFPTNTALRIDGTRIERNTVITTFPAGPLNFGAIRPRDGTGVVVRDNVARGPWSNGIASVLIRDGVIERNLVDGATRYGMFLQAEVRGTLFRGNDVTSIGGAAVFAQGACGNVFVANRLTPRTGHPSLAFGIRAGANAVLGPAAGIEDNGNFDCDGDGAADPNVYGGKSRRGGYTGEIVAPVMQAAAGTHAQ